MNLKEFSVTIFLKKTAEKYCCVPVGGAESFNITYKAPFL